jgi:hypothetical protein
MYVAHITVPVVFEANNDAHARHLLKNLRGMMADFPVQQWMPFTSGVEISDYPDAELQEVLPYELPRVVALDGSEVTP